jgi:hypothetical protein
MFCEKPHENRESLLPHKLTLSDKQKVLRRKKLLFYLFEESKANVRGFICGKKHWAMMCPATLIYQRNFGAENHRKSREKGMTFLSAARELLQTLQL